VNGKIPGVSSDAAKNHSDVIPVLSAQYMADAHEIADERIALAGYRLAAVLHNVAVKLAALPSASP
jgi:hypothetical protein